MFACRRPTEHELLGVTGREWRERAVQLRKVELVPVTQYAAACGLHPDLVVRLALVQLGPGPTGAAAAPVTWDEWIERSRRAGMGYHGAGLPKPGGMLGLHMLVWLLGTILCKLHLYRITTGCSCT